MNCTAQIVIGIHKLAKHLHEERFFLGAKRLEKLVMRKLNLPAHFNDGVPALRCQRRVFIPSIGRVDLPFHNPSFFQAAQHVRRCIAIHADFRGERYLIHSRFFKEDLHHTRLHRRRFEFPAVPHVNGSENLMQPSHQKTGTPCQCG